MRRIPISPVAPVILVLSLTVGAANLQSTLWRTGLEPGDAPARVEAGAPKPTKADTVLWQEGHPILLVKAGSTLPTELPDGAPLTVTVEDASGKPAAGLALQFKPQGLPNLPEPFGRTRTDDRGRAVVVVEPDRGAVIWIDDPAFLPVVTPLALGTQKVDLVAVPCGERLLLVRDPFGRALAGAQVKAMPLDVLSDPLHAARARADLVKNLSGDEVGRVALPKGLGHACACAWVPGCTVVDLPTVSAGATVVLQPAQALQVRVIGADTGKPVKGVGFRTTFASARIPWLTFGEKGAWSEGAGTILPGAYECKLTLKAEGWADLTQRIAQAPADGRLDLQLQRGVTLAGVVVDGQGAPVAKAEVDDGLGWDALSAETDATGAFAITGVPKSDASLTLHVYADGFLDKEVPDVPARETHSLRIVLDRGGAVVGRVVDKDTDAPVHEAKVAFTVQAGRSSQGPAFQVPVGADGTFRAAGLDPGSYDVRAWAPGAVAAVKTVTIAGTATQDMGEIELSGHPAVKGRLLDAQGDPPSPSATVRLERIINFREVVADTAAKTVEGTVGEDGAFRVRGVACGRYRFVAEDGDAKKVVSPVTVGADDVDLGTVALAKTASLTGQLVSRSGRDVSSWRVALLTQPFDFDPPTAYADPSGAFEFDDLPAGDYYLMAYPPLAMVPQAQQRVELSAGGHADVTVPIGGVTVTAFLTVDGNPAPGATVRVGGVTDSLFETGVVALSSDMGKIVLGLPAGIATGTADATGRVVLDGVTPGPDQAMLTYNNLYYRTPVTVPAEPQAPMTWNFQGLQLSGRVLKPDGTPGASLLIGVGYAGVGAMPGAGSGTDAQGGFTITGLGEGTITLGCRDEAGDSGSATVQLTAGQSPPSVTIQLKAPGTP